VVNTGLRRNYKTLKLTRYFGGKVISMSIIVLYYKESIIFFNQINIYFFGTYKKEKEAQSQG